MSGKYDVIVIDPPWQGVKKKTRVRKVDGVDKMAWVAYDYPVLPMQRLREMRVANLAADNCHLFLWTVQKHVPDAYELVKAWGFKPLLLMTWRKTGSGHGIRFHGFRWNSEFVLVARRGRFLAFPKGTGEVKAAFDAKNTGHSRKPDEFFAMVEPLGERRLELFARGPRAGWDVWGNEAPDPVALEVWE